MSTGYIAGMNLAKLSWCKGQIGTKPIGGAHQERQSVTRPANCKRSERRMELDCSPGYVGKGRIMQIADHNDRSLLLGIIDQDSVLSRNSVNYSVWKGEGWSRCG